MKKTVIPSIICMLVFSNSIFAQTSLIMVKSLSKWGFSNLKGEMIVPAQYDKLYEYSKDGFAAAFDITKNSIVFINAQGVIIPTVSPVLDVHGVFNSGLIAIKQGKKWGYADTQGKIAIPVKYDEITEFDNGYATAMSGGKWVIIDSKGVELPLTINGLDKLHHFSERLAPYRLADGNTGFVDVKGQSVIKAQFKNVGYFNGDLAWAKTSDDKVGYINKSGTWVIQPVFAVAKDFDPESGFARVKTDGKEGKWQYIDKVGRVLLMETEDYGDFSNGIASGKQGGQFGFFNTKGEWVIKPQFEGIRDFENGYAAAKQGGKWGLIDKTGKWVINPTFDGIRDVVVIK